MNVITKVSLKKCLELRIWISLLFVLNTAVHLYADLSINSQAYNTAFEVGKRVGDNVSGRDEGSWYGAACAWYGLLQFAEVSNNPQYISIAQDRYQPYLEGRKSLPHGGKFPVDANIFGIWPFELYQQTDDDSYIRDGKYLADEEWEDPRDDGLTRYTRFWCDDLYMIGSLQIQAYQALKNQKYADRCANQILAYADSLQKEDDGLFRHAYNTEVHWGRANGWVASALTEALLKMPADHPKRDSLLSTYRSFMDGLLLHQDETGMWRQIIDKQYAWFETSCSSMFIFALTTGLRMGWIEGEEIEDAVEKGWLSLIEYVDSRGRLTEICQGTEISPDERYYLERDRHVGDLHGQAPFLWAATAIIKLCESYTSVSTNNRLISKPEIFMDGKTLMTAGRNAEEVNVYLYKMNGRLIQKKAFFLNKPHIINFGPMVSKGNYILQIDNGNCVINSKFSIIK